MIIQEKDYGCTVWFIASYTLENVVLIITVLIVL